ncbi:hypothetical protein HDU96_009307 [Phlyctochytrium bullatum]|nr:hypothetical protein HDU96_009307 [Phlyctochytrium bullatum]
MGRPAARGAGPVNAVDDEEAVESWRKKFEEVMDAAGSDVEVGYVALGEEVGLVRGGPMSSSESIAGAQTPLERARERIRRLREKKAQEEAAIDWERDPLGLERRRGTAVVLDAEPGSRRPRQTQSLSSITSSNANPPTYRTTTTKSSVPKAKGEQTTTGAHSSTSRGSAGKVTKLSTTTTTKPTAHSSSIPTTAPKRPAWGAGAGARSIAASQSLASKKVTDKTGSRQPSKRGHETSALPRKLSKTKSAGLEPHAAVGNTSPEAYPNNLEPEIIPPEQEAFDNANLDEILGAGSAEELDRRENERIRQTLGDGNQYGGVNMARPSMNVGLSSQGLPRKSLGITGPSLRVTLASSNVPGTSRKMASSVVARTWQESNTATTMALNPSYYSSSMQDADRVQKRSSIYSGAMRVVRKAPSFTNEVGETAPAEAAPSKSLPDTTSSGEEELWRLLNPAAAAAAEELQVPVKVEPPPPVDPLAKLKRGMEEYFSRQHQRGGETGMSEPLSKPAAVPATPALRFASSQTQGTASRQGAERVNVVTPRRVPRSFMPPTASAFAPAGTSVMANAAVTPRRLNSMGDYQETRMERDPILDDQDTYTYATGNTTSILTETMAGNRQPASSYVARDPAQGTWVTPRRQAIRGAPPSDNIEPPSARPGSVLLAASAVKRRAGAVFGSLNTDASYNPSSLARTVGLAVVDVAEDPEHLTPMMFSGLRQVSKLARKHIEAQREAEDTQERAYGQWGNNGSGPPGQNVGKLISLETDDNPAFDPAMLEIQELLGNLAPQIASASGGSQAATEQATSTKDLLILDTSHKQNVKEQDSARELLADLQGLHLGNVAETPSFSDDRAKPRNMPAADFSSLDPLLSGLTKEKGDDITVSSGAAGAEPEILPPIGGGGGEEEELELDPENIKSKIDELADLEEMLEREIRMMEGEDGEVDEEDEEGWF